MPNVRRKPHADILTVAFVRELVAAQFPQWADLPVRAVESDGWDNTTFRLGDEMTVRLPSGPQYAEQVAKEQEWLPRLAPLLPLAIPVPLGLGVPSEEFPYSWSVYRWIEGETAEIGPVGDVVAFAQDVASFLTALRAIDASDGPPPGQHSYYRGASVTFEDRSLLGPTPGNWMVGESLARLGDAIDGRLVTSVWEAGVDAGEPHPPVWAHGDAVQSNLLVRDGRLHAVIDWGCSAVGDPACDLLITWMKFTGDSREAFRAALGLDDAAWARGRAWALWAPLYRLADAIEGGDKDMAAAYRWLIDEILADHVRHG